MSQYMFKYFNTKVAINYIAIYPNI